jgi:NAD(P)-dependent dehydrogenase (short-subunit alcohol dehydrogenase family)
MPIIHNDGEDMTMDAKGLAAVVTGAASGLGEATARALADAGAKVAVLDRNEEGAKAVAAEIGGAAFACDVSDAASLEAAMGGAAEAHGAARIAVSCAGIAPPAKIVGRDGPQPLDTFAKTIQVNLIGTFNLMRLAAAGMQALDPLDGGERGVIVNTASVAAFEGQIGQAAYSASKGGVASMTLPAAREFARHGIRVLAIAPGIFGTPMLYSLSEEVQASLAASVPFPSRLGDPKEYASLVMHMVSNSMLNGETVRLDGAIRLAPI